MTNLSIPGHVLEQLDQKPTGQLSLTSVSSCEANQANIHDSQWKVIPYLKSTLKDTGEMTSLCYEGTTTFPYTRKLFLHLFFPVPHLVLSLAALYSLTPTVVLHNHRHRISIKLSWNLNSISKCNLCCPSEWAFSPIAACVLLLLPLATGLPSFACRCKETGFGNSCIFYHLAVRSISQVNNRVKKKKVSAAEHNFPLPQHFLTLSKASLKPRAEKSATRPFQVFLITFYATSIACAVIQQLPQISISGGFASQSSVCKSQMAWRFLAQLLISSFMHTGFWTNTPSCSQQPPLTARSRKRGLCEPKCYPLIIPPLREIKLGRKKHMVCAFAYLIEITRLLPGSLPCSGTAVLSATEQQPS